MSEGSNYITKKNVMKIENDSKPGTQSKTWYQWLQKEFQWKNKFIRRERERDEKYHSKWAICSVIIQKPIHWVCFFSFEKNVCYTFNSIETIAYAFCLRAQIPMHYRQ